MNRRHFEKSSRRASPATVVAVLLLVALVAAACGDDAGDTTTTTAATTTTTTVAGETTTTAPETDREAELEELARAEGTLVFYTSLDPTTSENVANAFRDRYGIEVIFERLTGGPLAAKYSAEAEAGVPGADVILYANYVFIDDAVANGWMLPVAEWDVPNLADIPELWHRENTVTLGTFTVNHVLVNTDLVSPDEYPQEWTDLADDIWAGELYASDARGVIVTIAVWDLWRDRYGESFVEALAAQNLEYVESLVTAAQLVAAGERKAAFGLGAVHVNPLLSEAPNAPVELLTMGGPTFGVEWVAGLSANSANVNAGRLFINWLMTPEGQLVMNANVGPSVIPGVDIPGFDPLPDDVVPLDIYHAETVRDEILAILGLAG